MFQGYLEIGGVPVINTDATESYVKHLLPGAGLRSVVDSQNLRVALEAGEYRTPLLDDAAWVNPLEPATHNFYGLYPSSIEGLDDDTLVAGVTEYLSDGGSVGSQRRTSKSIRVTGLLVGRDRLGVQAGQDWLTTSLRGGGDNMLRYFVADPDVCADGVFGPVTHTENRAFGSLGVGVYRYRFEDSVPVLMPSRAHWEARWGEGAAVRTGAVTPTGTTEINSSLIVQPYRRNYATNPTFRFGPTGWSLTGAGYANWRDDDSPGYMRIRAIPASSLEPSGFGTGAFGSSAFGGDPATSGLGTVPLGTGPLGGAFGGTGPVLRSTSFALTPGTVFLSVALRSDDPVRTTLTLRQGTELVGVSEITPTSTWQRYLVQGEVPASGSVSIQIGIPSVETGAVDIDDVLLERTYPGTYFDGSTVDPGYTIAWEGQADASVSRRVLDEDFAIVQPDSNYRPFLQVLAGVADDTHLVWDVRPEIGIQQQLLPYERNLFDVKATSGVKVLREIDAGPAGVYRQVEFEMVAGNPAPFGLPEPIPTTPLTSAIYTDPEIPITLQDISWLADPNLYAISLPPKAPTILNPAVENITSWRRYYVPIPATAIPADAESVASVAIVSKDAAITQVRVRFHPNPFEWAPTQVDTDSYCSEFVLSYLPAATRMEVDGVAERAYASRGDRTLTAADHLLYGADGGPISWARLSCAIPYLMTVDVPLGGTLDAFDLELDLRRRF